MNYLLENNNDIELYLTSLEKIINLKSISKETDIYELIETIKLLLENATIDIKMNLNTASDKKIFENKVKIYQNKLNNLIEINEKNRKAITQINEQKNLSNKNIIENRLFNRKRLIHPNR